MSLTIADLDQLHRYFDLVMGRTHHHAPNVTEVVIPLIGAVLWKATNEIKVREQDGETKNVLWFSVGSNRYVFRYNHHMDEIELLKGSLQGVVIASFDNQSSTASIKQIFSSL